MATKRGPTLSDLKLIPELGEGMGQLFSWLEKSELTRKGQNYQRTLFDPPLPYGETYDEDTLPLIAAPTQRAEKLNQEEKERREKVKRQKSGKRYA